MSQSNDTTWDYVGDWIYDMRNDDFAQVVNCFGVDFGRAMRGYFNLWFLGFAISRVSIYIKNGEVLVSGIPHLFKDNGRQLPTSKGRKHCIFHMKLKAYFLSEWNWNCIFPHTFMVLLFFWLLPTQIKWLKIHNWLPLICILLLLLYIYIQVMNIYKHRLKIIEILFLKNYI